MLADIKRNGFTGMGKPELLKNNLSGFCSRRIDESNRLVYKISEEYIEVVQCKGHYDDKR